jgi:hypothetical protein
MIKIIKDVIKLITIEYTSNCTHQRFIQSIKGMHMQIIFSAFFKAYNITCQVFNISWKVDVYLNTCISWAFVKYCQMSHHFEKLVIPSVKIMNFTI